MDGKPLRSVNSEVRSYVLFYNASRRRAMVYWTNYEGYRVLYRTLARGESLSVDTFVGHPWTFEDADTGDSLGAMGKLVFFPAAPRSPGDRPFRSVVVLTYPVYSLRERCLQAVRDLLEPDQVERLELPVELKQELSRMVRRKAAYQQELEF